MIYSILFALLTVYMNSTDIHVKDTRPGCAPPPPAKPATLMTSDDMGGTWQEINSTLPSDALPYYIWVDDDQVYLGTGDGVFTGSAKCSGQWTKVDLDKKNIGPITAGKDGPYVVSYREGIYQHQDSTWTPVHGALQDKSVYNLLEWDGALYAGCSSGIYKSNNWGMSWNHVFRQEGTWDIKAIDGYLFTCALHILYRSADRGLSWKAVFDESGGPFFIGSLAKSMIIIVNEGVKDKQRIHNVYQSTDNGSTWKLFEPELPSELINTQDLVQVDNFLIASGRKGVYRSSDMGKTWECVVPVNAETGGFYKLQVDGAQLYSLWIEGC